VVLLGSVHEQVSERVVKAQKCLPPSFSLLARSRSLPNKTASYAGYLSTSINVIIKEGVKQMVDRRLQFFGIGFGREENHGKPSQ